MLCIDSYMYVYITFIGFRHSLMDWCFVNGDLGIKYGLKNQETKRILGI